MLKKAIFVLLLGILAVLVTKHDVIFKKHVAPAANVILTPSSFPTPTQSARKLIETKAIFVPYWSLGSNDLVIDQYDRVFYFGVKATFSGINKSDDGYRKLPIFVEKTAGKKTYFTIQMLDDTANDAVLRNSKIQETISREAIQLAKENSFSGIVLDLELKPTLDEKEAGRVNDFVHKLYTVAKSQDILLSLAMYGDTFYRNRPFDVSYLAKNSDEILIMAYDFHKSRGDPGPNFPLDGATIYGYDFAQMLTDYGKFVPPDKTTVVFGMYGYDWTVDEKQRPIKPAKALSLLDIKKQFIDSCQWKNCLVNRDSVSGETEVDYVEAPYQLHIVWFEDEESIRVKGEALRGKGIGSTAYWVYGYF